MESESETGRTATLCVVQQAAAVGTPATKCYNYDDAVHGAAARERARAGYDIFVSSKQG